MGHAIEVLTTLSSNDSAQNLKTSRGMYVRKRQTNLLRIKPDHRKYSCLRRHYFIRRFCRRLEGSIWGFFEGIASGALTGTQTAGKGGWIMGGITQTIGAFCGAVCGGISGAMCGFMSNKYVMMAVFEDYRKRFGSTKMQSMSGHTNVDTKAWTNKLNYALYDQRI